MLKIFPVPLSPNKRTLFGKSVPLWMPGIQSALPSWPYSPRDLPGRYVCQFPWHHRIGMFHHWSPLPLAVVFIHINENAFIQAVEFHDPELIELSLYLNCWHSFPGQVPVAAVLPVSINNLVRILWKKTVSSSSPSRYFFCISLIYSFISFRFCWILHYPE